MAIKTLYAAGMKGLSFKEDGLTSRTVFTGGVGSGKSARSQSLWLLVTGQVPGTSVGKRGGDLLSSLGDGESLHVGVRMDDDCTFERQIYRTKSGTVTQVFKLNGKKVAKGPFDAAVIHAIQLCDVSEFLAASDAKQLETVLSMIPGNEAGRIRELAEQETSLRKRIADTQEKIRGLESSRAALSKQRADIPAESMSLAEVSATMAGLVEDLSHIDQEIGEERGRIETERREKEAREHEAAATGVEKQEQASLLTLSTSKESEEAPAATLETGQTLKYYVETGKHAVPVMEQGKGFPTEAEAMSAGLDYLRNHGGGIVCVKGRDVSPDTDSPAPSAAVAPGVTPEALARVVEVMEGVGCGACTAKMLLKKLIREAR